MSRRSIQNAFATHYVDSIFISDLAAECKEADAVYDIGSGAGFPGVVFAIRFPDRRVHLFEKSLKKLSFLTVVVSQLGLANVTVQGAAPDMRLKGVFLARAVFPRAELFDFMGRRMTSGSCLITNLGATHPFAEPPPSFLKVKEIAYTLPLECGGRRAEILKYVPRGTK